MRLGLFVALFATLLAVLAVVVPLPIAPAALSGGVEPLASAAPRCLRLAYEPGLRDWSLPTVVRLYNDRRLHSGWYVAHFDPWPTGGQPGYWRPAGRDSVDIVAHHGPRLIRVGAHPPRSSGRVTPRQATPLVGLIGLRDYRVSVADTICP